MISSVDRRSEYVENRAGANVRLNNFLTPYTLDDKSSILNAPCGYSNGVYASLRPVETFGPELITNGDFATDSNWTKGTGWSIANGKASRTAQSGSTACDQSISLIAGKKYKIVYTLTISAGSFNVRFSGTTNVNGLSRTTSGTYVDYLVAATGNNTFRLVGADGSFVGSIDNVSVKEVTDADFDFTRGSAATRVTKDGLVKNVQILSDDLVQNGDFSEIGSELITNGDFSNNGTGWNYQLGWTFSNNQAHFENLGTSNRNLWQSPLVSGKFYKLTFEITSITSGFIINANSSITDDTQFSTVGIHTQYFKADNVNLYLKASSDANLSIDNVSVKEVGQNWTFGTGWSIEDGVVSANAPTGNLDQSLTVTSGSKYRVTFTISNYVSGDIRWRFTGTSNENGTLRSANGTYTEEITLTNNQSVFRFPATGGVMDIDSISVIEITDDTDLPRIDYTNGTGSLLLEPQSTNLITYSEDFSQWVLNGTSRTFIGKNELGLDYWEINGINNLGVFKTQFITVDSTITSSVFVKKSTSDIVNLRYGGSIGKNAHFDLTNGVVLSADTGVTAKIKDFGNGWFRISNTYTTQTVSTADVAIYAQGGSIYASAAQLEELSYATSYIPTSGSSVTRNADVCNNAGSSDLINSTEGVLYFEGSFLKDSRLQVGDGSSANAVVIGYAGNPFVRIRANSLNSITEFSSGDLNTNVKIAISYKSGDTSFWINGVAISENTSAFTFTNPLNEIEFISEGNRFFGNVKCVAVFKEALTDEELAKITSTTQQEVFYEMRDKMLQIDADYYEFGDYTTRLKKLF